MKILKSYWSWIPLGILIALLVAAIILYFPWAGQIFKIHWLILVIVLVIACGPWGKIRLGQAEEPPRYRPWAWLLQVIFLQVCYIAVFWGISVVCAQSLPILTSHQPAIFQKTMLQLGTNEGLFPWAFVALLGIIFGFYSYNRRMDAYFAATVSNFRKREAVDVVINFIARLATALAYAGTLCLIALLWVSSAAIFPIITDFRLTPILVSIILIGISFTKLYRRNVKRTFGKEIPLIPGLFFWLICFAVAIWLINGFLEPWTNIPISPPSLLKHWLTQPWNQLWLIFANSWWLLWSPILAISSVRISRGYRLRWFILVLLAFPLFISIATWLTRQYSWDLSPQIASVIAGAGLLGVLGLTLQKKAVPSFILSYLPRQDHYKFRSYQTTVIKTSQFAVAVLFIYLPGGMAIMHFLAFAAALPLILIGLAGAVGWFYQPTD